MVRVTLCDDTGAIVDERSAIAGSANVRSDPDQAQANIVTATKEALAALKQPPDTPKVRMVAALAGAGDYWMQTAWVACLQQCLPFQHVEVVPDAAILFAAAQVEGPAVASIVGTGSIAWARDANGEVKRAGGLGPEKGDEGSAYWIGLQCIRQVANADANPTEGELRDCVLRHMQCDGIDTLRDQLANRDFATRNIAELAPAIFDLAANGSQVAKRIVSDAAVEIAKLLTEATVDLRTSAQWPNDFELPWVAAGGVAVHQTEFMSTVRLLCREHQTMLAVPKVVREPVTGAVRLAIQGS